MMRRTVCLADPATPLPALTRAASTAASLGYDGLWTNEAPGRDAFPVLAGFAAAAPGDTPLGVGVVPVAARPPLSAAAAAAGLAELARRPIRLGIGSGHAAASRRLFGVHLSSPVTAVAEYATILRRLLDGEAVSFSGAEYAVEGARLLAIGDRDVRVVVAAMGPRMLETAAATSGGALLNWTAPEVLAGTARDLRRAAGERFLVACYVRVAVDDRRPDVAREVLRREIASYLRWPAYRAHLARQGHGDVATAAGEAWRSGEAAEATATIPDEMVARLGAAGTTAECRAALERYESPDVDEIVIRPVPVGDGGMEAAVAASAPGGS